MARPIKITGRVDLIAAIYDEDNLPTAVVMPAHKDGYPFCLHSLREGNESTLEGLLLIEQKAVGEDAEPEFKLFKFFEDYPNPSHKCLGCHHNHNKIDEDVVVHTIADSNTYATKQCADCA
jgi:hypothetical protein